MEVTLVLDAVVHVADCILEVDAVPSLAALVVVAVCTFLVVEEDALVVAVAAAVVL